MVDGTWDSVDLMTWTLVETDVYLIAACLPTYRPLFLQLLEKTRYYVPKSLSGFKYHRSGASSCGPPSAGSKLGRGSNTSAGFQRLRDGLGGVNRGSLEDEFPMVEVRKDDLNKQEPLGPNQIRVQNDYEVKISV